MLSELNSILKGLNEKPVVRDRPTDFSQLWFNKIEDGYEESIKAFCDEHLVFIPGKKTRRGVLYGHFVEYCRQKGLKSCLTKTFVAVLQRLGYKDKWSSAGHVYIIDHMYKSDIPDHSDYFSF